MKCKNNDLYILLLVIGIVVIINTQCKKDESTPTTTPPATTQYIMKDIDGNSYHYIKIGTQYWMVENLKTTKYRDGTSIANISDTAVWSTLTTGAYCNYQNNAANVAVYGRLYNWYAVNDPHNIAPSGWHVAADSEWTKLTVYLGGDIVAGDKLKESGTTHWRTPNPGATNSSGFTALPGGYRSNSGTYFSLGEYGYWWTSTKSASVYGWTRNMFYNNSAVNRNDENMPCGLAVRCVKD